MTQQQYNSFEREFGWEDTIEKDSEYVLLPDGLYHFTVIGMNAHDTRRIHKIPENCQRVTRLSSALRSQLTKVKQNYVTTCSYTAQLKECYLLSLLQSVRRKKANHCA